MVSPNYALARPAPPSTVRRYFDQQVMPMAIDAAGELEALLEQLRQRTRRYPLTTLGLAACVGLVLSRTGYVDDIPRDGQG
jgi:hypothetical protein